MIITIGRQHGSNGNEIAKKLAELMGYPCYDKELVDHAADISTFSKDVMELCDERRMSPYAMTTLYYVGGINNGYKLNVQIASAQFEAIRRLADKGNAVFVGRCADYVLRDRSDVLKVFIMADAPYRAEVLMARKGISEEQAKKLIREVDKDRGSYYRYYTDRVWGEASNYDLCIDSGPIGVEGTVKVIRAYMEALGNK